jgi:eukaryotic-like serine/threonine-protein kinase
MSSILSSMSADELLGRTIAEYRLETKLGEGSSGIVFLAVRRDERCAVKVLRPEHAAGSTVARFLREAHVAREIDSRHVVPILEVGESEDLTFLAMPFYEGGSLANKLADGPLGLEESAALAAQLGRGLDELHARGIVHRDVKPSNILLDASGAAALSDFGLARAADSTRLTAEGQILGTPHYLAPELIEGGEASVASDVYALGCVLYECLTGAPPFAGSSAAAVGFAHLTELPRDPRELRTEVPAGVAEALLLSLEKDPRDRPTSGTALARLVHAGRTSAPV